MRVVSAILAGLAGLVGCGANPVESTFGTPTLMCRILDKRVNESSGLAASSTYKNRFYTHNDSGGKAEVYVFDKAGTILGAIKLKDASNFDWEDMDIRGTHLFVADIGDNQARRKTVVVYRFTEPSNPEATVDTTKFELRYPDRPQNAEGFFVDKSGGFSIISKTSEPARVYYCQDPQPGLVNSLRLIGTLPPELKTVTAAACSADGKHVIVRSYAQAFEFAAPKDFLGWISETPQRVGLAVELQGEAIAYFPDANSLITSSEFNPCPISIMHRQGK